MGERTEGFTGPSLSNYGKATHLLAILALGVASCSPKELQSFEAPMAEPVPETETVIPAPTEFPSTPPEAFSSQQELLEAHGYVLERRDGDGDWAVFEEGAAREIIRAVDAHTLVYKTTEGEEVEVAQESFVAREVAGVGVSLILTIENKAGVSDFYLNRTGIDGTEYHYWTSPIEIQKNPEIIDNYTPIELEDVWSGRLLYSELLVAQPFPEGTLVPDKFVYWLHRFPKGFLVELSGYFSASEYNWRHPSYVEFLNEANDWRRWISFYRSKTPSGVDVIIGTQQAMAQDGQSSLFFHYVFGPEWPTERDDYNLVDNVFLSTNRENAVGDFGGALYSPAIYFEGRDEENNRTFFSHFGGNLQDRLTAAGIELYGLSQNNPVDLTNWSEVDFFKWRSLEELKFGGNLNQASSELASLQYMSLLTHSTATTPDSYFNGSN